MKATRIPVADRLHAKLQTMPNGCIEFVGGHLTAGYGVIGDYVDGRHRSFLTHRVAWEMTHGPIPPGLYVCHKCDRPPCCNPEHLFLGTNSENLQDLSRKGLFPQQRRSHCPVGHSYDVPNTYVDHKGKRSCRTCRNDQARARYWAKKGLSDPRAKRDAA